MGVDGTRWHVSLGHHTSNLCVPRQGSSQEQEWAGAWRATTFPLVTTEGETALLGRAFGASLGASSQGAHPLPAGLLGSPALVCVGCNLITSQPTALLVGALRSQGLCAWEMPAPRSPFSAIQIRYSEPFMKILIKPETAAPAFPLLLCSHLVLFITISSSWFAAEEVE